MRHYIIAATLALGLGACTNGGDDPFGGGADAAPAALAPLVHEFPEIVAAPAEEVVGLCHSWTLHNETPLFLNVVELRGGPGWHHSNWTWVPDDAFDGPDGVWPCKDREFDEVSGGIRGGVLTAQSTQALKDVQAFPEGHALFIPERVRIIGTAHVFNATEDPITTHLGLTLTPIPEAQVTTRLHGLALQNRSLALQPMARSRFTSRCELDALHQGAFERPLDFNIHYVLPHYHSFGTGLTLEAVGGTRGDAGEVIWQTEALTGEPAGGPVDPPYSLSGATGIRFTCAYENPTDQVIRFGLSEGEMCVLLAFTDSPYQWAGGVQETNKNTVLGQAPDGTWDNQAPCEPYFFPPRE